MVDVKSADSLKSEIKRLYETNPNIHVNISLRHPKLSLHNVPVTICGVYKNIFRLEENTDGESRCHTVQYRDVLLGHIEILELRIK